MEEKESGARDLMLIHGLQPWVLHCAWAATYLAIFALVSAAVTVVCTATFLHRTPPSLLLVGALLAGDPPQDLQHIHQLNIRFLLMSCFVLGSKRET